MAVNNSREKVTRQSVSLHPSVKEMARIRAEEEGYAGGMSAYVSGLILFDAWCRRKHALTLELMNGHVNTREKVIADILERLQAGESKGSSWFDHRVEEIAQKKSGV
jgi:hypothetical protein